MKTFNFVSTPSHGYLTVSHKDILDLGIQYKISHYSYCTFSSVHLEEDRDASKFIRAYSKKYGTIKIKESYSERFDITRDRLACYDPSYLDFDFSKPFAIHDDGVYKITRYDKGMIILNHLKTNYPFRVSKVKFFTLRPRNI